MLAVKLSNPVATSNWIETNSPCGPHDAMPTEPRMVSVEKGRTRTHARTKPEASPGVTQGGRGGVARGAKCEEEMNEAVGGFRVIVPGRACARACVFCPGCVLVHSYR